MSDPRLNAENYLYVPGSPYPIVEEGSPNPNPDRPPIDDAMGFHVFVESEFEKGAGRCDKCGGGPLAAIHQVPVDHMARIADALTSGQLAFDVGRIAGAVSNPGDEGGQLQRIADALERIADYLKPRILPHDFVPMVLNSGTCSWCGEPRSNVVCHPQNQDTGPTADAGKVAFP